MINCLPPWYLSIVLYTIHFNKLHFKFFFLVCRLCRSCFLRKLQPLSSKCSETTDVNIGRIAAWVKQNQCFIQGSTLWTCNCMVVSVGIGRSYRFGLVDCVCVSTPFALPNDTLLSQGKCWNFSFYRIQTKTKYLPFFVRSTSSDFRSFDLI